MQRSISYDNLQASLAATRHQDWFAEHGYFTAAVIFHL